jgi:nicotinate-nucleotide pyrophosphorylase (carboxylating)
MRYLPAGIDERTFQQTITDNVRLALAEDVGSGDVSAALIDPATHATARVITRDAGVISGLLWVAEVCRQVDERIELKTDVSDGDRVTSNQQL